MSVNLEVKGNVARLLATENLIVENKRVETASFNVETRVLTLPLWQRSTDEIYDLLVAHEVSHALFTPNEDWDPAVPHQFLNVVEDVRVEKLIKRKFAGLSKTFYRGYEQFYEEDFFEIEGKDVDKMNLADKINLYFKIGSFLPISFSEEEKEIRDLVGGVETFDEAQAAALVLHKYCKGQKEKEEKVEFPQSKTDENGSPSDDEESYPIDPTDSEEKEETEEEEGENEGGFSNDDPMEVETDSSSMSKIKDLVDLTASPSTYLEYPNLDLSRVINSNKEIHDYIEDFWCVIDDQDNYFRVCDYRYNKFKKEAQKEVNYLVKEFEMKKAASAYSRSSVSSTGVLDTSKLHTYKFNDDLFRKVTTIPDGKNHGLAFILDWSGSMGQIMEDTIKQLYSLIWFCKKVGIPFSVYAFTYQFNLTEDKDEYYGIREQNTPYERAEGVLNVPQDFSLMEFFTSDTSGKVLEKQMRDIYRVVWAQRSYSGVGEPPRLGLSGTPLNETIVTLRQLIPALQKKWGTEKTQCVILTDGEASHLPCDRWVSRDQEMLSRYQENNPNYEGRWSRRRLRPESDFLRNRKTGKTYSIPHNYWEFTSLLIESLKGEMPYVNFIGMRLIGGRDANEFIRRYYGYSYETGKLVAEYKKNKAVSLKIAGYDTYFGISTQALSNDTKFDVDEGATKAKIKSAFAKSLKSKKLNKKVLNEFVELIS